MRTAVRLAIAASLLTAPLLADGAWKFKEGNTWTWEGTTEFHYAQGEAPSSGGTATAMSLGDPQWESVTLRATVLSVDPDGASHLEFAVEAVRIETRFDSSGEHAEWDSMKTPETDLAGYKRYQAIVGRTFRAVVGPDGSLRGVEGADWAQDGPPAEVVAGRPKGRAARAEKAARETHDPTPPSVWLALIFGTTPERRAKWNRDLLLHGSERLSFRPDGEETVGSWRCGRTKLESLDKKHLVRVRDVAPQRDTSDAAVAAFAVSLCDATRKRGTVWFSRALGGLVKAKIEAATEFSDGLRLTNTTFRWGVELKETGTTTVARAPSRTTPTK